MDLICKCGHSFNSHMKGNLEGSTKRYYCMFRKESSFNFIDLCEEFVPDNIKYLEELASADD